MALNAYNRKEEITPEKEAQAEHNPRRINEIIKIRMEIIKMENRKKSVFWKKANYQTQKKKNISTNPTEIQKDYREHYK